MAKKNTIKEPPQVEFVYCSMCVYASDEKNHMHYCSVLEIGRSTGKRKCSYYKKNI